MIISPFNAVFFALIGVVAAVVIGSYFLLRKQNETTKKIFILSLCAVNLIIYVIYKLMLPLDAEYVSISGETSGFFEILPLQLCNINLFLIPIAVLTKNRYIAGFSFFVAPIAAIMPMIFPEPAFIGFSLSLFRIFGYYFTHSLIIICGLCLGTLGYFKPKFKNLPGVIITFIALSLAIHGINTVLRMTVYPTANYFFTYDAGGVSALEMFRRFIDVPYLYEMPALLILCVYMAIICSVVAIVEKTKNK